MSGFGTYVLDSNSLITPYRTYYPFDLAPGFWDSIAYHVKNGRILIVEDVKKELVCSGAKDELSCWFSNECDSRIIHRSEDGIFQVFAEIMQSFVDNPLYNSDKAVRAWSDSADPWIIAAAVKYNSTIVTFEGYSPLTVGNKCSKPKIPTVAKEFGVRVINLFELIRELKISIS